jgi:hypothetical protein
MIAENCFEAGLTHEAQVAKPRAQLLLLRNFKSTEGLLSAQMLSAPAYDDGSPRNPAFTTAAMPVEKPRIKAPK